MRLSVVNGEQVMPNAIKTFTSVFFSFPRRLRPLSSKMFCIYIASAALTEY